MKKKQLQLIIGTLVSLFFIWFAFYAGGVTFAEIWDALTTTNWFYAVPFMAITMASFYWRAIRWKILVDPVKQVPSHRLFGPLMAGFAFNNIIPARLGEFVRPVALLKQEKVPLSAGLSTVLVERLVDVLTLLFFLILTPYYVDFSEEIARTFKVGERTITLDKAFIEDQLLPKLSILALVLMAGIVSFLIRPIERLYVRILQNIPFIPDKLRHKLVGFLETFCHGFDSLRSPKAIVVIALHSLGIWLALAFSFQLMSWGFERVDLTFAQGIAFLVVTCVVISLPSSPGYFGLYEFGGLVALLMLGVVPDTKAGSSAAFTYSLVVHFLQWAPITVYGLIAAAKLSLSAAEAEAAAEEEKESVYTAGDVKAE